MNEQSIVSLCEAGIITPDKKRELLLQLYNNKQASKRLHSKKDIAIEDTNTGMTRIIKERFNFL